MSYVFSVSPDFGAQAVPSWYMFDTWLQRVLGEPVRLELFESFAAQRQAIAEDKIDLIYANPFDAALLIRKAGFVPVAAPAEQSDEALIAVNAESPYQRVEDLPPGTRLSSTDDPAVHMMGMILLEPANLDASKIELHQREGYVLVAKDLVRGEVDAGFFLEHSFRTLSSLVRNSLRELACSRIYVIRHVLMAGTRLAARRDELRQALVGMADGEKGQSLLESLGLKGWSRFEQEDAELMIDLMDTLVEPRREPFW